MKAAMIAFWVAGALCLLLAWVSAQPQPRLPVGDDDNWGLIEFANGSQWYIRANSINAIQAIPEDKWEAYGGVKTIVYGPGYKVNIPYTTTEVGEMVEQADMTFFSPKENANER